MSDETDKSKVHETNEDQAGGSPAKQWVKFDDDDADKAKAQPQPDDDSTASSANDKNVNIYFLFYLCC